MTTIAFDTPTIEEERLELPNEYTQRIIYLDGYTIDEFLVWMFKGISNEEKLNQVSLIAETSNGFIDGNKVYFHSNNHFGNCKLIITYDSDGNEVHREIKNISKE